jgi:hypothetical protein
MIQMNNPRYSNLDVCGIMVRDREDLLSDCPCVACERIIFEAWERMTYGGLGDMQGPGVYKTVDYGRGPYVVNR